MQVEHNFQYNGKLWSETSLSSLARRGIRTAFIPVR